MLLGRWYDKEVIVLKKLEKNPRFQVPKNYFYLTKFLSSYIQFFSMCKSWVFQFEVGQKN